MNDPEPKRYWFPAKRYGWGWGLPATWQGWVVLAVWTVVFVLGNIWLVVHSLPLFFIFVAAVSAILIGICYLTGEPPRWRWGGD
jgi:hypothetical protein